MDLLDFAAQERMQKNAPLAERMRPVTLDQFVGQDHILGPGRLLRRAILADQLSSLIFYGPPGTGKTTLAQIIANQSQSQFLAINAVLAGIKDIREAIKLAEEAQKQQAKRSILFIDEVHRFNKAQQDALLPHVERGLIVLVGATTENPFFEVNKALVSRSRVFELQSLEAQDLERVIDFALSDSQRGFGQKKIRLRDDAKRHLASVASGDARAALNALELAVVSSEPDAEGVIQVDLAVAEDSIQRRAVLYDKDGDAHFDIASAFIKSIRGSDPDAALYWMARMLYGGEDPKFLFRRMIISASEDIGLADPRALEQVMAAAKAYEQVGMPEGRFHLAQACLYLATAPKSNSNFAFFDALKAVEKEQSSGVPNHLKDPNRDQEDLGHGKGYLYPHAYRDHWIEQQYLPAELQGRLFYQPGGIGFESNIKNQVEQHREALLLSMAESGLQDQAAWEQRSLGSDAVVLSAVASEMFALCGDLGPHPMVLCVGPYAGLLAREVLAQTKQATLFIQAETEQKSQRLSASFSSGAFSAPQIVTGSLSEALEQMEGEKIRFDFVLGAEILGDHWQGIKGCLRQTGQLITANRQHHMGQRLSEFLSAEYLESQLGKQLHSAEEAMFGEPENPKMNRGNQAVETLLGGAQLVVGQGFEREYEYPVQCTRSQIETWFSEERVFGYAQYLQAMGPEGTEEVKGRLAQAVLGKTLGWKTHWGFFQARPAQKS